MRTPKNRLQDLAQNLQRRQAQNQASDSQKQTSGQGQRRNGGKPSVETKTFDHNQPIDMRSSEQGQNPQTPPNVSVEAMAFDHNEPIELRYNQETGRYAPNTPTYAAAHAMEPNLDFGSEAFEVESFDADPVATAQSMTLQSEGVADQAQYRSQPLPLQPEVVADQSPLPIKSAAPPVQAFSANPVIESQSSTNQEVVTAEDFLEDLQAILKGEKTYDGTSQQVVDVSPQPIQHSTPEASTPASSTSVPVEPAKQTSPHDVFDRLAQGLPPESAPAASPTPTYSDAHSVFDRMGKNMAFANSFDLGTISLQQRFDEFDRMLDAEETSTGTISQTIQVVESESQYTASLSLEDDRSVPYHSYLYHLDLCILAYQLYNQTLIWPLDPWYERLAKWYTSRRTNFLKQVHRINWNLERSATNALYSGPNNARRHIESNLNLDPIISDLLSMNPKQIGFSHDDASYRVFQAPKVITDRIDKTFLCYYADDNERPGLRDAELNLNAGSPTVIEIPIDAPEEKRLFPDELYAFEGGTGVSNVSQIPAWSIMGYVLKQYQDDGNYDVRIVFRGSQSGWGIRSLKDAEVHNTGNPDWVTDMNVSILIKDKYINQVGKVCQGFSDSIRLCLNTITKCLETISQQSSHLPPRHISVAGHSLGGALAAQFCSAVLCGGYRVMLNTNEHIGEWPWDDLQLFTFGAPVVGDPVLAKTVAEKLKVGKRVWVTGDFITWTVSLGPEKAHIGESLELRNDSSKMKESNFSGVNKDDSPHEPMMIRYQLLQHLYPNPNESQKAEQMQLLRQLPWRKYKLFKDFYDTELPRDSKAPFLTKILGSNFIHHLDLYIESLANILNKDESRLNLKKAFNFTVDSELRIDDRLQMLRGIVSVSGKGNAEEYLRLCLCLKAMCIESRATERPHPLTDEILSALKASENNRIKQCFNI